jgi:3-hydroxyacyl-CoA dehydrogenase/enoyl-CoA hydratase/3-hydroxybutyryl-CoA epimerase/3-hydroxyacyl-CoA dehydrogenase/enoyl-CoA hydratase/3-hydroxybutyryl-CoA epimerase/enoyl-CoA isomerase
LRSGKPGQFVAGADLNELADLSRLSRKEVAAFASRGQEVFDQISQLPYPTVALIDGPCLGGGAEYALAADYRIASDNPRTRIGLPEVGFGIIPGWGGTQRLPRLIGVSAAIEMICSGEPIPSSQAMKLGLVSEMSPADRLVEAGCRLIDHIQQTGEWQEERRRWRGPVSLSGEQLRAICATTESDLKRKTKGHNPGPLAALRVIQQSCTLPLEEGLEIELAASLELMGTPISTNLIAVFLMKQQLVREPGVADSSVSPRQVKKVGVLGAGLMGSGIATAHARSGIPTAMVDLDQERLARGIAGARAVVTRRIESGRATPQDLTQMLEKLSTSTNQEIFADCDLVVEAITEDEASKAAVYRELAGVLSDNTILASNTSTISITRLAAFVPRAEQFLGLHFFNPVDRMQLVEVVRGEQTSDETVATAVALARRIGKTPIVVRDGPGFLVNRVLFPYLNEAVLLLLEGASMDAIDEAATRFGMPMGPLLLHDVIGLDTVCSARRVLLLAQGERADPLPILADLVQAGRLGQKSGTGFRKYDATHPKGTADPDFGPFLDKYRTGNRDISDDEINDRLFLPMLLEATRVLEEGIVRQPAHVDMGVILGIGFPPFRGGILRWCDTEGAANIVRHLVRYATLRQRFQPTPTLERLARSAGRFSEW